MILVGRVLDDVREELHRAVEKRVFDSTQGTIGDAPYIALVNSIDMGVHAVVEQRPNQQVDIAIRMELSKR